MLKIGLISLGCSKNQVDSELMLGILSSRPGLEIINNINEADVIIINTCAFIKEAREESIETILEAAHLKKCGNCRVLIVTGCLTQRYKDEILREIPEIDAILGTGTLDQIGETLERVLNKGERVSNVGLPSFDYKVGLPRILSNSHFAYVKVAEGCNNKCTYCSIPEIRGPFKSRSIEDIVTEVNWMSLKGVKEIILIAQDLTRYGVDLYGRQVLTELLKKMIINRNISWIRLMYNYPKYITDELIDLIAKEDMICNYLDLPIQHSSDKIRHLMNRRGTRRELFELIKKIRRMIPDIVIRTAVIVGFPGEREEDFNDLTAFIEEVKFDRLGVFKYSREEGTAADKLPDHLPEEIKEERYNIIMAKQQEIAYRKNQELIGQVLPVIIDEFNEQTALARSQYDAPEVDNQIYLPAENLRIGDIVNCRIKEAYEYDLIGERR